MYKIKLSPYHKIFYNEWKLSITSYKYNIVFDQIISCKLDIFKLKIALHRLIIENIIFNSHVQRINEEYYWVKNKSINYLEHYNHKHNYTQLFEYVSKPFNLENDPLYRFGLFNTTGKNYRLIIVLHHILIDGSKFDNLINEISNYYNDDNYKNKYTLQTQITLLQSNIDLSYKKIEAYAEQSKLFWSSKLLNIEPLDITFIKKQTQILPQNNIVKELRFSIKKNVYNQLLKLFNNYKLSIYSYSQIVFAILLNKYTSQHKFAISYPILIKGYQGLDFGAQINTSISPYNIDEYTTIADLITQNNSLLSSMKVSEFNYAYYPIYKIFGDTQISYPNISFIQTNLKNHKFKFKNTKTLKINHEYEIDLTNLLSFEQQVQDYQLHFQVKYNMAEIDESILLKFIYHYQKLFYDILADLSRGEDNKLLLTYSVLNKKETNQIVNVWNKNTKNYPLKNTIHKLFEKRVAQTPNNIAIAYNSMNLTYNELNKKANQIARYLRSQYKIEGDDLIAFCLDRSEYSIIALLSILKTGGAYIPIEPSYPDNRIVYILQNARVKVVITEDKHHNRLNKLLKLIPPIMKINMESINHLEIKPWVTGQSTKNLARNITSNNLAYVIYTSGTTGNPKGVMVEHKSVVNYIYNIKEKIFDTKIKKVDFSTNIGFDLTVTNTIGALCCGQEIYIYTQDVKNLNSYREHLITNKINIIKLSPSYFQLLLNFLPETHIDTVILGGEKLPVSILYKITKPNLKIFDEYGPTEATVGTCISKIYENGILNDHINIGKAYHNYRIYILDKNLAILPVGAIGELYIGGKGIARGYLNQVELTKQKFISHQFQGKKRKWFNQAHKLYRTGDLVRYLSNGTLEYIGRVDLQVKIHGYRIELAEIESVINSCPEVKQSAVVVIELTHDSTMPINKALIAYYVSDCKLDETLLFDHMAVRLPEYMLPITLIHIKTLPLTINGKLDRTALPKPQLNLQNQFVAPSNQLEDRICRLYSEILNLNKEDIGTKHDFFKIGGNSILAIHLTFKLQNEFEIGVNDIFKLKTPAKIAQFLQLKKHTITNHLDKIKLMYKNQHYTANNFKMDEKYLEYLQEITQLKVNAELKKINKVLLTGSTGHLGNHILYQLLFATNYKIYLLVRAASSTEAYARVRNKFRYYFNFELDNYLDRITIFVADIEKPNLNLSITQYQELVSNVESIIHAAASVKHYGDYNGFYQANVIATINLLELAKLTLIKDFHYISTLSVLKNVYIANTNYQIITENDVNLCLEDNINIYSKTKYQGELAAIQYRQFGVNSNIYRVGNLAMNSSTYLNQENINENAFFTTVKTFLTLGMIPREMVKVEISPVDYTASAIIKLFDKSNINNQIYHIANKFSSNLFELFKSSANNNVKIVTLDEFFNVLLAKLETDNNLKRQIELFMLHQGWLEISDLNELTKTIIFQDKTDSVLAQLGFEWTPITNTMLSGLIEQSKVDLPY